MILWTEELERSVARRIRPRIRSALESIGHTTPTERTTMQGTIFRTTTVVANPEKKAAAPVVEVTAHIGEAREVAERGATFGHTATIEEVRIEGAPKDVFALLASYPLEDAVSEAASYGVTIDVVERERYKPTTELMFPEGSWAFVVTDLTPQRADDGDDS